MERSTQQQRLAPLKLDVTPDGARLLEDVLCREYDTGTLLKGADVPEARALIRELETLTSGQAGQPTLEDAIAGEPARLFEPTDQPTPPSGFHADAPAALKTTRSGGGLPLFEEAATLAAS